MNPLRKARLAHNYSQIEFAELIGVTGQTVKLYEAGQKNPPDSAFALLNVEHYEFQKWKTLERYKVMQFLENKNTEALKGQSNEYMSNLLFFKKQLQKMPQPGPCRDFNTFIKTYFTSKSFCSKLLMINHSTLDRHVNGFPVPMKEALMGMGLSDWARKKESDIYG